MQSRSDFLQEVSLQVAARKQVRTASAPDNRPIYQRGGIAEAELAVPGWRIPGDEMLG